MNNHPDFSSLRSVWTTPKIPAMLLVVWWPIFMVPTLFSFEPPKAVLSLVPCILVMHLIYVYTLIGLQSVSAKRIMFGLVALSLSAIPVMMILLVASGIYYIDSGGGGIVLTCMLLVFGAYITAIVCLLQRWQRIKDTYDTSIVSAAVRSGQSRKMQRAAIPILVVGACVVFFGITQMAAFLFTFMVLILVVGLAVVAVGVSMIVVGIGLRRGRRWAKILAIPAYVLIAFIAMLVYWNITVPYR